MALALGAFMSLRPEPGWDSLQARQEVLDDLLRESAGLMMLGRVARSVAHEIANLLVGIQAEVYSLPPSPESDRASAAVEMIVDRARDLLQRLLRASAGQGEEPSTVSLTDVVTRLAPLIARLSSGRVKLDLDLSSAGLVHVRAADLEIVLVNLCMNAMDAMPKDGTLKLTTCARAEADKVVLEIQDTGRGMPDAQVADLFRCRVSSAPGRHTGLGMAIVDALVAEMHGTLELESTLGVGTTVRIVLPIRNVIR